MRSEELKLCPFCGGDVSFHKDEECPGCHLIQCGQCRAFFDFATGADPGNDCASVDALRAAIAPMWNTRAQLAAIQGGMGEVVEVVAYLLPDYAICRRLSTCSEMKIGEPLMTVAQHQHITAAMAAELAGAREELESMHQQMDKLRGQCGGFPAYAEIDRLRAELASVKGE